MRLSRSSLFGLPPSWVLPGAALDFDFERSRFFQQGGPSDGGRLLTVSRSSIAYQDYLNGIWAPFPSNTLRITDKGTLIEEARTNIVLWCRDLTNVAWTKSNVTAALDQVGIDGAANSASSIAATAGNGTALQAITLASSARFQSAFVKRITGSGVVNMTMDGGATWTAVAVTSAWTQVAVPTQTLANPSVGFRLVTNGDKIAVDFVQNENSGLAASSPILTTTGAATRAADVVTASRAPVFGSAFTVFGLGTPLCPLTYPTNQAILSIDDGTTNNRMQIVRNNTTGRVSGNYNAAATNSTDVWGQNTRGKLIFAGLNGSQALSFNGAAIVAGAGAGSLSGLNSVHIGARFDGTLQWNGYIGRVAVWPATFLPNATLQALTQ